MIRLRFNIDRYKAAGLLAALALSAAGIGLGVSISAALFNLPGLETGPGEFLLRSYGILAYMIPVYLFGAAILLADARYRPDRIFVLAASAVPFFTLALGSSWTRNIRLLEARYTFFAVTGKAGISLIFVTLTLFESAAIACARKLLFPRGASWEGGGAGAWTEGLGEAPSGPALLQLPPPLKPPPQDGARGKASSRRPPERAVFALPAPRRASAPPRRESAALKALPYGALSYRPSSPGGGVSRAAPIGRSAAPAPAPAAQPRKVIALPPLRERETWKIANRLKEYGEVIEMTEAAYAEAAAPEKAEDPRALIKRALANLEKAGPPGAASRAAAEAAGSAVAGAAGDGSVPRPLPARPIPVAAAPAPIPFTAEDEEALEAEALAAAEAAFEAAAAMEAASVEAPGEAPGEALDEEAVIAIDLETEALAGEAPAEEAPAGEAPPQALSPAPAEGPEDQAPRNADVEEALAAAEEEAARREAAPPPPAPKPRPIGPYSVPVGGILNQYPDGQYWIIDDATRDAAMVLKETLKEFNIQAEVTGIRKGPVITMFEILPAPGVKLSKIVNLQDNIALRLAAASVRIVAPIPGKHAVGIEVPNPRRSIVSFREIIEGELRREGKPLEIPVVLGKDITGEAVTLDLVTTPHLLIAGATGSGKSVCVNTMILSILYQRPPSDCRLILIDPKIVELKLYNGIPHLLTPVITEPKKAFQALQYCIFEMERRYACLDSMGVRDLKSYNRRIKEKRIAAEHIPYIVVVIDEFADLMATTGKELESTVARLAAMSRAVGIHLVLATQRPSIDVITGLIKANIPSRIAFMVASKMDSRIIIDMVGAEKLLGKGDMLYAGVVDPFPIRMQGAFVSEEEVERVVDYVKTLGEPDYIDDEMFFDDDDDESGDEVFGDGDDPLYDKALEIVVQQGKASASYIQRRLKIGYNRAARLVEDMERHGVVGPAQGSKPRELLHGV